MTTVNDEGRIMKKKRGTAGQWDTWDSSSEIRVNTVNTLVTTILLRKGVIKIY